MLPHHSPIDLLRAVREDQYDARLLDDVLRLFLGLWKQYSVLGDTPIGYYLLFFYGALNWFGHLVPMYHITDARDFQGRTITHFAAAGMKLAILCHSGFLRILKPYFLSIELQWRTTHPRCDSFGRDE
jgi:hypothetical protein